MKIDASSKVYAGFIYQESQPSGTKPLVSGYYCIVKRGFDIIVSIFTLIMLLPLYLICAIGVKINSQGSILYFQERIGKNKKPFQMIKFRSMIKYAEVGFPKLSFPDDSRVTSFGRFMRKWHLDELPQFYNILKGDMSLIGPRPERQFYIDQIIKTEPQYQELMNLKPGITSLGQIKYGYAETLDQMIERLAYDIYYLENYSFWLDFYIFYQTLIFVLLRKKTNENKTKQLPLNY